MRAHLGSQEGSLGHLFRLALTVVRVGADQLSEVDLLNDLVPKRMTQNKTLKF